ncbi:hypothetical protein RAD04_38500, partial [Bradyrhizobium sp. 25ACV]
MSHKLANFPAKNPVYFVGEDSVVRRRPQSFHVLWTENCTRLEIAGRPQAAPLHNHRILFVPG